MDRFQGGNGRLTVLAHDAAVLSAARRIARTLKANRQTSGTARLTPLPVHQQQLFLGGSACGQRRAALGKPRRREVLVNGADAVRTLRVRLARGVGQHRGVVHQRHVAPGAQAGVGVAEPCQSLRLLCAGWPTSARSALKSPPHACLQLLRSVACHRTW
jgi:hypothetical protein